MADHDTIVAHSSGRPPAAIAVIRLSGTNAHAAAEALCGKLPAARQAAVRRLRSSEGRVLDDALVLRFDAPASATGEDLVELHCHGGRAVVAAVLAAIVAQDHVREAQPGEFTRRALANGRIDLTEAEGLADLLEAETETQRRSAMAVAGGEVRRTIEGWRRRVIDLSAQAEAAIDYVGDEEETALDGAAVASELNSLLGEWNEWLARPRTDLLRHGPRVVLAGPPNAGKSSLLNALAGEERAIVTHIAGTTRDIIEVPLAIDGIPLLLVDTAGLRESDDVVERIGVDRAEEQLRQADILLWLGDPELLPKHQRATPVHARADERPPAPPQSMAVSALTGQGMVELKHLLRKAAQDLLPATDSASLNQRQAGLVSSAADALAQPSDDLVILAEQLRQARSSLDRVIGVESTEDMLDALFGRFCLGK